MKLHHAIMVTAIYALGATPALAQDKPKDGDERIGVLLAAGDIAECRDKTDSKWRARSGQLTAELIKIEIKKAEERNIPVGVLAVGDLAYPLGEKHTFFDCFNETWGTFKDKIFPVPGNHEYEKFSDGRFYFEYFKDRLAALNAHKKDGYYAVRFPPADNSSEKPRWLLVGLNSERLKKNKKGENAQLNWLDMTLKNDKTPCVLAFSHGFFYGSGRYGHGSKNKKGRYDAGKPLAAMPEMKDAFDLLYARKASLLISGHDHHFEQFGPANGQGEASDKGAAAMVDDGVRSFIVGTGGAFPYPEFKKDNVWAFTEAYALKAYGILKINLYRDHYSWRFIATTLKGKSKSPESLKNVKQDNNGDQMASCNHRPQ